jgi:ABC-2 type transport system ATP-binding protein
LLRVEAVRKSFADIHAVRGVSFEVRPGEVFGLLGPNGAGKSTTIAMAVGLLEPDAGAARLGERSPADPEARRGLGLAPQALALYDDLSGEENVCFFGRLYGLRGQRLRDRARRVLELVGLADRARDRAKVYSGGMKRRLNLAAAIVHDPAVLLLDEPTAGVDPQSRTNILDLVRSLAGEGKAVLYTTHYMEEAQRLCARVGIMDRGVMLDSGDVPALVARHGGESVVTLSRDSGDERRSTRDPLSVIAPALAAGGVRSVRIDPPDLESVFLALTGRSLRDE